MSRDRGFASEASAVALLRGLRAAGVEARAWAVGPEALTARHLEESLAAAGHKLEANDGDVDRYRIYHVYL